MAARWSCSIWRKRSKMPHSPFRHLLKIFQIFCVHCSDLYCCWGKRNTSTLLYFLFLYIQCGLFHQCTGWRQRMVDQRWKRLMYMAETPICTDIHIFPGKDFNLHLSLKVVSELEVLHQSENYINSTWLTRQHLGDQIYVKCNKIEKF